jgi:uncharacterized SAM-binding protein YcdF (DUF218 family)
MTEFVQIAMFSGLTRKRKWLLRMALAAGILIIALATAAISYPQTFLCLDSGPAKADVIIVLGGSAEDRPAYAAKLFQEQDAPKILVSGAGDDVIYRHILIASGVPRSAIQLEPNSRSTVENAQYCAPSLRKEHVQSAIIVTSWYHSRRALKCFEHYMPEIKFYSRPTYFALKHADWTKKMIRRIFLEYLKLPGYWVHYGVCPF